ncbi:MAG TPA: 50S ribosomal protein L25 [Pirellulaceae bacterium]|jgi:large subunit ribosomal protein L25|nr:50S ribosomal protein L25 [Pirellulaceae bacterium]
MSVALQVSLRESSGRRSSRRIRNSGQVPAILYGHGEPNVSLAVNGDSLRAALKKHAHVVTLTGGVDQEALIKDVQYDYLGVEILHIDFGRVSKGERLELSMPVHLKGEAPGVREGAVVTLVLHEVQLSCPVSNVPADLHIDVTDLHVDQSIHASDIKLPEGVRLVTDPSAVVVTCTVPVLEVEETTGPAEPELIEEKGKSDEEGEGGEGGEE